MLALAVRINKNVRKIIGEKEELAAENGELMQLTEFMQLENNITLETLEENAALEETKKEYEQCKAERNALLSPNKELRIKSTA